jgi:hypothetical protein
MRFIAPSPSFHAGLNMIIQFDIEDGSERLYDQSKKLVL